MDHDKGNKLLSDFVQAASKRPGITLMPTRFSRNVYEVIGLINCYLYIKARSEDPLRWGVTSNVIDRLRRQDKPWWVLLLYVSPNSGYLFSSNVVTHHADNKIWPLAHDGDYKPSATPKHLAKVLNVRSLDQLFGYLEEFTAKPFSAHAAIESASEEVQRIRLGGQGESDAHKELKMRVYSNPGLVGLNSVVSKWTEYLFPSGDRVDVAFHSSNELWTVVEIELAGIPQTTIGLFQAVKYRALQEAVLLANGSKGQVNALLVAKAMDPGVKLLAAKLGVNTFEL